MTTTTDTERAPVQLSDVPDAELTPEARELYGRTEPEPVDDRVEPAGEPTGYTRHDHELAAIGYIQQAMDEQARYGPLSARNFLKAAEVHALLAAATRQREADE